MNARIISIGDELTLGLTIDTNSAWLSQRLAELGIAVTAHVTVADLREPIRDAIDDAARRADLVLVTGGLGPTDDDLTRQALADALDQPLERHQPSLDAIRAYFARFRRDMPERNTIQAMFPRTAVPIDNTCGTAPGIRARLHDADIFAMPGVPLEMRTMYERDVLPALRTRAAPGRVIKSAEVHCFGAGESTIADHIADLMARGSNPTVGTTAKDAIITVRITAAADSPQAADDLIGATRQEVVRRLGRWVFGHDAATLAQAVAVLLTDRHHTLAVAESCTGGLLAKMLTDVPGASAFFLEGLVTYSNRAKTDILGVAPELIASQGAVSEPVARAMAQGCRRHAAAHFALAITGIAGPTGGSPEKPVGLVYIALAAPDQTTTKQLHLGRTRDEIRDRAAKAALNLLRLHLTA